MITYGLITVIIYADLMIEFFRKNIELWLFDLFVLIWWIDFIKSIRFYYKFKLWLIHLFMLMVKFCRKNIKLWFIILGLWLLGLLVLIWWNDFIKKVLLHTQILCIEFICVDLMKEFYKNI